MLRGTEGFLLLLGGVLVSKFVGFLVFALWVPKIIGLKASWFQSFLVSKFLGFKVSKMYQSAISCFLEDVDPTICSRFG